MKTKELILAFVEQIIGDSYLFQKLTSGLQLIATVNQNYSHIIELEILIGLWRTKALSDYSYINKGMQVQTIDALLGSLADNTMRNRYRTNKEDQLFDAAALQDILQTFPWKCKQYNVEESAQVSVFVSINDHILAGDPSNPVIEHLHSKLTDFQSGMMAGFFYRKAKGEIA